MRSRDLKGIAAHLFEVKEQIRQNFLILHCSLSTPSLMYRNPIQNLSEFRQ